LKSIKFAAVKLEKIEDNEQSSVDPPFADDNDDVPDDVIEKLELKYEPTFQLKNEEVPCEIVPVAEVVKEPAKRKVTKSKVKKRQCNVCGAIVINLKGE
jgi:hypothetical protein